MIHILYKKTYVLTGDDYGYSMGVLKAVEEVNEKQKSILFQKIWKYYGIILIKMSKTKMQIGKNRQVKSRKNLVRSVFLESGGNKLFFISEYSCSHAGYDLIF